MTWHPRVVTSYMIPYNVPLYILILLSLLLEILGRSVERNEFRQPGAHQMKPPSPIQALGVSSPTE